MSDVYMEEDPPATENQQNPQNQQLENRAEDSMGETDLSFLWSGIRNLCKWWNCFLQPSHVKLF